MQRMFSNKALRQLIVPLVIEQALAVLVGMADTMMVASVWARRPCPACRWWTSSCNVTVWRCSRRWPPAARWSPRSCWARSDREQACESANQLVLVALARFAGHHGAFRVPGVQAARCSRWCTAPIEAGRASTTALTYLCHHRGCPIPSSRSTTPRAALCRSMGRVPQRRCIVSMLIVNAVNVGGQRAAASTCCSCGVAGVAVPTLVSRIVGGGGGHAACMLRDTQQHELHLLRGGCRPDFPMMRRNPARSPCPAVVENSLFQLGRLLVVRVIAVVRHRADRRQRRGQHACDSTGRAAGWQTINLAVITVVGQCVGARDFEQVKYYATAPAHRLRGQRGDERPGAGAFKSAAAPVQPVPGGL